MKVTLLDLAAQYREIRKEVLSEIEKVCDSQHYVLGPNVVGLEAEIAGRCGAGYAIGVASGTDAILIALMACGVGHGDYVVTTPFTFFATAGSIARLGAYPLFVDIDPMTYNISPEAIERALRKEKTGRIKAIIPVHLYGQCAAMSEINKIARKRGAKVIEDAAQSIGAKYKGKMAGILGDLACFSFYPTKNLGCFGDGGMVTTNNKALAHKVRILRVHGSSKRYFHELVGVNSRLDELQAAILRVKLKHLDAWTEKRIANAERYEALFKGAGLNDIVGLPFVPDVNYSVFNQYVIRVKKRDALREFLKEKGIGSEVYYPLALHEQRCFKYLGYKKGAFPETEKAAKEVLALPIYAELTGEQQGYVVGMIAEFFNR